jgi:hypothetical protein
MGPSAQQLAAPYKLSRPHVQNTTIQGDNNAVR